MPKFYTILFCLICSKQVVLGNIYTIKIIHDIQYNEDLLTYELIGVLPQTVLEKQRVIDIRFPGKQGQIVKEGSSLYYQFNIDSINKYTEESFEVEIDIEFFEFDFQYIIDNQFYSIDSSRLDSYLLPNKFHPSNSIVIKKLADKINGKSNEEILEKLYNYVMRKVEYKNSLKIREGAKATLLRRTGNTLDFADLLVTLCKQKNIPARIVNGYLLSTNDFIEHFWSEAYLENYGWVPLDPFPDAATNGEFDFYNLPFGYLYLGEEEDKNRLVNVIEKINGAYGRQKNVKRVTRIECENKIEDEMFRFYELYKAQSHTEAYDKIQNLLLRDPENISYLKFKGMILARMSEFDKAQSTFQLAFSKLKMKRHKISLYYSYANFLALKNEPQLAISYLTQSIKFGFNDFEHMSKDIDLISLYDREDFKNLLKTH